MSDCHLNYVGHMQYYYLLLLTTRRLAGPKDTNSKKAGTLFTAVSPEPRKAPGTQHISGTQSIHLLNEWVNTLAPTMPSSRNMERTRQIYSLPSHSTYLCAKSKEAGAVRPQRWIRNGFCLRAGMGNTELDSVWSLQPTTLCVNRSAHLWA